jgi:16S rRNA processing protein RimM
VADESLILMGHITGAFGVRGEVRLHSYTDDPESIGAYGPLLNERGDVVLTPKRVHTLNLGVAITAPEIKTREQAEALKGTRLYVPRARLPAPDEDDEFYAVDLVGCAVQNLNGDQLGEVIAIHDFGAGDVLEIKRGTKVWYLPFTAENAPQIDLKAKRIIADPPDELLDLDAKNRDEQ